MPNFFHNFTWKLSAFGQFSKQMKNDASPKYQDKIVAIFTKLLSINFKYCSLLGLDLI